MTLHFCTDELLIIETLAAETPDDTSVSTLVNKSLKENGITDWHSLEISQFSVNEKRLILAIPVRVFIPKLLEKLIKEIS